jgi:hypothetical protein
VKNVTYGENEINAMMQVISVYEKQKITHGKSNMRESPHQEDMMTKTHWEDRESYVHKSSCREVANGKAYIEDVDVPKNQQTLNRKSGVHDLPRGGEGRGLHGN